MSTWSPFGPVSNNDCPEGMICIDGQCIQTEQGSGLYEFINEGHVVEFDPTEKIYTDYELTNEDHQRFDNLDRSKEEIEIAKQCFVKIKGKQAKHNIDDLVKHIEDIWIDRANDDLNREIQLYVTEEGLKLFDEHVRKEFDKTKEIINPVRQGSVPVV
jgi:hypothetical protein